MTVLATVAGEIASVVTHLARYPSEIGRRWVATTDRPPHEAPEPIVLLPAWPTTRRCSPGCGARWRTAVPARVVSFGYSPLLRDVRAAASDLAGHVERLCEVTGAGRVSFVGHSLGGLIARYHVQRLGGHTRVDAVVTVATPHGGTLAARGCCPRSRWSASCARAAHCSPNWHPPHRAARRGSSPSPAPPTR